MVNLFRLITNKVMLEKQSIVSWAAPTSLEMEHVPSIAEICMMIRPMKMTRSVTKTMKMTMSVTNISPIGPEQLYGQTIWRKTMGPKQLYGQPPQMTTIIRVVRPKGLI